MNKLIKSLFAGLLFISLPSFASDMNFEAKENIVLKGKISTVKTSKKYRNVEACQALCQSRSSCVAFTLNTSKGSCTILKNVSSEVSNEDSTSGIKNS